MIDPVLIVGVIALVAAVYYFLRSGGEVAGVRMTSNSDAAKTLANDPSFQQVVTLIAERVIARRAQEMIRDIQQATAEIKSNP